MWYVVQTMGGQEKRVLDLMKKIIDPNLVQESFIPRCEIMKRVKGSWHKRSEVLMPGYIFVITDYPGQLKEALRRVPRFTRLLGNNDVFVPLDDQETVFISAFTKPESRVVELSIGVIEGDRIVILCGPLMHQTGLIRKIDRHKRLAYLDLQICGRVKTVKVGLEIVRKKT